MSKEERNITWQSSSINRQDREKHNGHRSRAIWFTGLSGAGKSSLAFALEQYLYDQGVRCYVLDGDNVRHGLNRDLGFTAGDRQENLRRIGEVSKLMVDAGLFVLSAFISPHEQDREMVRQLFEPEDFIEIYVSCSIQECERRDPKGLYKKARNGDIPHFTGISAPYDVPKSPSFIIDTEQSSIEEAVQEIVQHLEQIGALQLPRPSNTELVH
ncbi:adenylyl-sulfate kinase [Paenibacillus polymyxa]|uniref:adenylyl-sulfate kinase n=1 Tax=Paenibacillus TaxID=44249 RepID=UPI00201D6EF6|nr:MULTISPECIES: adenylyl-sulfate kinase [Paenibacillus]MCL6659769.1 adenylyl-sulfate kinase [Paenibacillus amylolyticus]UOK65261.1 adenylyl-sulfate kinase [Paenibacillus sp. OVF10]WJM10074.1 adenylyl-sulfate kinase [Paenibacillus sp. PK1-4R]